MQAFSRFAAAAAVVGCVAFGVVSASSLVGCDDPALMAQSKTSALENVGKASAKLTAAKATLDGLMKKVDGMPADMPGVADFKTKLLAQKGMLEKLAGTVQGFTGKIEEVSKSGKKEDVDALSKNLETELMGLTSIEGTLTDATKSLTEMEMKAKLAMPTLTSFARKLSTGYDIKASSIGIEHDLIDFVDDTKKVVDKTTWFNFDQLTFKTGGAELDMDKSKAQLENVVEIMKAYPKMKLKVGGYTDNTGPADANKKISAARAEAVKKAVVAKGIDAKRLEAEGYGPEHAVCEANDTDECKAKNRRIAVRVSEK